MEGYKIQQESGQNSSGPYQIQLKTSNEKKKQAGVELCQAQRKVEIRFGNETIAMSAVCISI